MMLSVQVLVKSNKVKALFVALVLIITCIKENNPALQNLKIILLFGKLQCSQDLINH